MSNEYHRATFCQWVLEAGRRLAAKYFIRIFLLTESIINTTPIRIRMVTTLMIERMPLSATDKQTGRAVHLVIALCQGHSLYQ